MNAKIMAMMMVGVMMFSGFAITMGNEDNTLDAVVGDGGAYSYTLTYHSDQMSNTAAQETQLTVADMTPISHASGTTTLSAVANEGSWAFNTTTGFGPFNSFYAAFDMTDGNKFVTVLNPYDLTEAIDGTPLGDLSNYNIMWVLPTVYWSVDNNGNLKLTNDLSSGIAYAHTINGHTYKYLAIGVYEASASNLSGYSGNVLKSQSNVAPSVNQSPANYLTFGSKYNMDSSLSDGNTSAYSMVWNFYQWELYKYCAYTVMEGFEDSIVGNGNVYNSAFTASTTGSMNGLGPYVGNPGTLSYNSSTQNGGDPVKLFIENAWGSASDYVSGVVFDGKVGMYVNTANSVTADGTTGDYVEYITQTIPDSGWITDIVTSEKTWGFASATQSDASYRSTGLTDKIYSNSKILTVGGYCSTSGYDASAFGLNFTNMFYNMSDNYMGTRLAFVMDKVFQTSTVSIVTNNSDYGSVSSSSISNIQNSDPITISGNTISYGNTTVTATPTTANAQYTYSFVGWYNGATLLLDGNLTVTSDMTITAHFARSLNDYIVTATASSYGSVSPASVTQPYGSAISASGNVLTIGSQTITATPDAADAQYTYTFTGWSTFPSTLTANTSVTANFDRTVNTYTITWDINGSTTSETLSYGAMPEHEDPVPPEGYLFAGWNPEIAPVTGDQTYTAVFEEIVYITVTFDPNGGQLEGSATKTVGIGTPYGELPTPKKDNNKFLGWYTDPEEGTLVTADTIVPEDAGTTLYAHWELTGFAAMLKPLLFLFPLILLAFLAIALVRTFA